jgi:hypothetical protein
MSFLHELDGLMSPEEYDRDVVNGLTVLGALSWPPNKDLSALPAFCPLNRLVVGACLTIAGTVQSASAPSTWTYP